MIQIVSKRGNCSKKFEKLRADGWIIIDVTSKSDDPTFRKFSPMHPHGGIPVIGWEGEISETVEGIWQGLKVFENEGINKKKFSIKTMKGIKRGVTVKTGRVKGHMIKDTDELLGYVEARKRIYIPTYEHVLQNHLKNEVELLRGLLAEGNKIAFLDYDINEDVENTAKPLSHASLIKKWLAC